jgi:poly(A)-specific ribonuclease
VKGTDSFHEAGYDSLLTANVMIRLSAKLDAEGTYIGGIPSDDEQNYVTAPEDNGGISLDAEDGTTFGKKLRQVSRLVPEYNIKASPNAASSTYSASNWLVPSSVGPPSKKKKKKATSKKSQDKNGSRFASPTMFEGLRIEEAEELEAEDSAAAWQSRLTVETEAQSVSGSGPLSWDLDVPATDSLGPYALPEIKKKEAMVMMPQFDSDFWRVYGNKLRVFGTEENVLALTG